MSFKQQKMEKCQFQSVFSYTASYQESEHIFNFFCDEEQKIVFLIPLSPLEVTDYVIYAMGNRQCDWMDHRPRT